MNILQDSRIRLALGAIPSILIGLDDEGVVVLWNSAAEKAFDVPAAVAIGTSFFDCPIEWDWQAIGRDLEIARGLERQHRMDEVRYRRPQGDEGVLGITVNPMRDTDGRHHGLLVMAADITDRKRLEAQLAQAQRMESIGQLAAGIAHEINTPTQYIGDNTRFLRDAVSDLLTLIEWYQKLVAQVRQGAVAPGLLSAVEAAEEEADLEFVRHEAPLAIEQSLQGIERVSRIVKAMKEFSHPGTEEMVAVDINRAIDSAVTVSRNEWKYVAELETDYDPELPLVPCLPGDFNQVMLNLIVNAAHAIAESGAEESAKGRITLTTRRVEDITQNPAEWVEIRVADTGTGIPERIRPRIFDPFFTTKEVGRGTGQGLAIAHSIVVDKHRGTIHFETEVGRGTTFIVRLPLTRARTQSSEQLQQAALSA